MPHRVQNLIDLSRRIGADPIQVLAGGGNSSVKTGRSMWVKASGTQMATMTEDDLVEVDLAQVKAIPDYGHFSSNRDEKEHQIAQLLLAARINPRVAHLRPSVETVLHALLPQRYVLHTHNEIVNALCFSKEGPDAFAELQKKLGRDAGAIWMEYVDPGLTLAQALQQAIEAYRQDHDGEAPNMIFMAKHGHLVAADTVEEIEELQQRCQKAVESMLRKRKREQGKTELFGGDKKAQLNPAAQREALARLSPLFRAGLTQSGQFVHYMPSEILEQFARAKDGRRLALGGPLCPDQIVYCLPAPLWFDAPLKKSDDELRERVTRALQDFREKHTGRDPQVILLPGIGCLGVGDSVRKARTAALVYESMVRSKRDAACFGGLRPLTKAETEFIDTWSSEQYRRKLAAAQGGDGRAKNRIIAITGAGQGVGRELALELAAAGATVAVLDINADNANAVAHEIQQTCGDDYGMAVNGNITSESDMRAAVAEIVAVYGGLDVMIANAGILKAFKITDFAVDTWRQILDVNLAGTFITFKAAAEVMVRQHSGNLIQINSKSGKVGSRYNSAYAASKFGGIGLVQSLALDLLEDNVRVNAICPGNFFDLPLWSAPGGLFDQYRQKFDGASREEVRRIYESKIPMGRGCRVSDVARTVLYIMEQEYETGQAYNVTGGQQMS